MRHVGPSEMRGAERGLGTGVYEGHGSPGFGGVNDSSLLFVYRVLGPIIHLIYLVSTHVIRLSQARRLPAKRYRPRDVAKRHTYHAPHLFYRRPQPPHPQPARAAPYTPVTRPILRPAQRATMAPQRPTFTNVDTTTRPFQGFGGATGTGGAPETGGATGTYSQNPEPLDQDGDVAMSDVDELNHPLLNQLPPRTAAANRTPRIRQESREGRESREYLQTNAPAAPKKGNEKSSDLPPAAYHALTAAPLRKPGLDEPKTFGQAMKTPSADAWRQACVDELTSHHENGTWTLVDRPSHASVIKGRWVFKLKTTADGVPQRFKARWVAKGFTQRHGIDYDETYASVVKSGSVKTFLIIAASRNWEIRQYDIKTAFLNAPLDREVFVEQPHGFTNGSKVCRLRKALYGLKQSPLLWYDTITTHLRQQGWEPIPGDECVFQKGDALLVVYVDDLAIAAPTAREIDSVALHLSSAFELTDLGPIHHYLGCRIIRNRAKRLIWILQDGYIKSLAQRFNMDDSRPVDTPMDPNLTLVKASEDYTAGANMKKMYQSLIGGLMWPSIITRIDISFATTMLSRLGCGETHFLCQ